MFSSRRQATKWSMAVCGDVMLGRGVATAMSQNGMFIPLNKWLPILNLRILLLAILNHPFPYKALLYQGRGSG